jgi:hypothetical protein
LCVVCTRATVSWYVERAVFASQEIKKRLTLILTWFTLYQNMIDLTFDLTIDLIKDVVKMLTL